MNRNIIYLMILNTFMSSVYGFIGNSLPALRQQSRLPSLQCLKMEMDTRRDLFMKPAKKLALALPLLATIAKDPKRAFSEEYDDSWAKHNGLFTEEWLKDFQKSSTGLLYKDVEVGKGDMPNEADAVSIHMVGYIYETGEKWTNTYKGIPTFQSTVRAGVRENQKFMKGLNEGVKTMRRGGKRILVIPAYLAYNYTTILAENNPNAPIIPGGSSLVCYVEVLDFKPLKK